jgi:hypothetical protein
LVRRERTLRHTKALGTRRKRRRGHGHRPNPQGIVSTVLQGRGGGSGVNVNERYVFAYRIRDGLVVEGWEHHTMDEALAALRERTSQKPELA